MTRPTVLVTGASGFLGRHLLRALHAQSKPAAALVRDEGAWRDTPWWREAGEVVVVQGTPLAAEALTARLARLDVQCIIHAAGLVRHSRAEPEEMMRLNVEGTLQMVRAAHALRARLVFVSSSGTVVCIHSPLLPASPAASPDMVN